MNTAGGLLRFQETLSDNDEQVGVIITILREGGHVICGGLHLTRLEWEAVKQYLPGVVQDSVAVLPIHHKGGAL